MSNEVLKPTLARTVVTFGRKAGPRQFELSRQVAPVLAPVGEIKPSSVVTSKPEVVVAVAQPVALKSTQQKSSAKFKASVRKNTRRRLVRYLSSTMFLAFLIGVVGVAAQAVYDAFRDRSEELAASYDPTAELISEFLKDGGQSVRIPTTDFLDTVSYFKNEGVVNGDSAAVDETQPQLQEVSHPPLSTKLDEDVVSEEFDQATLMGWQNKISFIAGLIAVHRPTLTNTGKLSKDIVELSLKGGVDPFYIAAIISVESRFGTGAKSNKGATGLMQLMPGTARDVVLSRTGQRHNPSLTEPRTNIALGIAYIKQLEAQYNGNRKLALAAYNWGPGNVDDAIGGKRRIPKSVVEYAKTILDRSARWHKQFEDAKHNAHSLIDELT